MKKIIYEGKIKTRVITPAVPAVVEHYEIAIPRTVWDCDFCATESEYRMPECLGCGKTACYRCKENKNIFEDLEFEVGDEGCYGDACPGLNDIPESDDHRVDSFYLCKECRENPPEKIKLLMKYVANLEDIWKEEYDLKIVVMDEIERVKEHR